MKSLFGVSVVLYFMKILSGSHNFWSNVILLSFFHILTFTVNSFRFSGGRFQTIVFFSGCNNRAGLSNCRRWSHEGYCRSYMPWMSANCQLSCRRCGEILLREDIDFCAAYFRRIVFKTRNLFAGQSSVNSFFILILSKSWLFNCLACKDNLGFSDCETRVSAYECESNPEWMAGRCKLSCGFCGRCAIWDCTFNFSSHQGQYRQFCFVCTFSLNE